ncbi:hypothetical protein HN358_02285 [Candidatus Uhrbacteria bacterium]|nr:hypothetical protein [Candidatus Uhrbacteria bacterium]MBT7717507.1 hypothetical protein [Candidatus Uhrbacteria bacterium]
MATAATQIANVMARAQLNKDKTVARRAQKVIPRARGNNLPSRRKRRSRSQVNMAPAQDPYAGMPLDNPELIGRTQIPDRNGFASTNPQIRKELEAQAKANLQLQRQRIRSEMASYKLPKMPTSGYEQMDQIDNMQSAHDKEYLKQLQTPEFNQAAMDQADGTLKKIGAKVNNKRIGQAKKKAQVQANKAAKQAAKAGKIVQSSGKMGWDAENILSLLDSLEPGDFEIPTIFTIIVQMYRATTSVLNDGKKFIKGFLSVFEPAPLYRFWSIKDAKRAIDESSEDPLLGGGTELENLIESMCLGWPEAIIGWYLVLIVLLHIVAVLAFFIIILLGAYFIISPIV